MNKILYVVTVSQSLKLLYGQLNYLIEKGYDVHVITSSGKEIKDLDQNIQVHIVEMKREISLIKDTKSLFYLIKQVKKIKPIMINYGTPKASLLSSIASYLLRVPNRVYTIRGLRYETMKGKKRTLMINIEKLIMKISTHLVSISPSMRDIIKKNKLSKKHINVLGSGSSNGIPIESFKQNYSLRLKMRKEYQIKASTIVLGYVGRLASDKGISTLVDSFTFLEKSRDIKLLLIGDFDNTDLLPKRSIDTIKSNDNIIHVSHQKNIAPYYQIMDIFIFPTLREGFGNVSIEAGASGLPVIASNVTGAKDTIINNKTGLLFEVENDNDLITKIEYLLNDKQLMIELGHKGRDRVQKEFDNKIVWNNWYNFYQSNMK